MKAYNQSGLACHSEVSIHLGCCDGGVMVMEDGHAKPNALFQDEMTVQSPVFS